MTVREFLFEQGKANGKRENSIVRMYVFREAEDNGPLKSILSRSIGCVALIRVPDVGR